MWKLLSIIALSLILVTGANAQNEDIPYSSELRFGINFNTNGGVIGGFSTRHSRMTKKNVLRTFSVDLVEIKHFKEQRTSSFQSGQAFIFGKQNHLFVLRPQYGREMVLFQKYPQEGVRLSAYFGAGPTFGFVKPYYVEYDATQPGDTSIVIIPFTEDLSPSNVLGGGFFFRGFGEIQVKTGLNFKAALNFEFGRRMDTEFEINRPYQPISGIETGFSLDVFQDKIPILGFAENKNIYTGVYVILYYGRRW